MLHYDVYCFLQVGHKRDSRHRSETDLHLTEEHAFLYQNYHHTVPIAAEFLYIFVVDCSIFVDILGVPFAQVYMRYYCHSVKHLLDICLHSPSPQDLSLVKYFHQMYLYKSHKVQTHLLVRCCRLVLPLPLVCACWYPGKLN